jgi:hypothetical protein
MASQGNEMTEPTITRMYPNGPLRLFSEERFLGGVSYRDSVRQGFVGPFICEVCQQQTREVIVAAQQWVCRGCVASGQQRRDARGGTLKGTRSVR